MEARGERRILFQSVTMMITNIVIFHTLFRLGKIGLVGTGVNALTTPFHHHRNFFLRISSNPYFPLPLCSLSHCFYWCDYFRPTACCGVEVSVVCAFFYVIVVIGCCLNATPTDCAEIDDRRKCTIYHLCASKQDAESQFSICEIGCYVIVQLKRFFMIEVVATKNAAPVACSPYLSVPVRVDDEVTGSRKFALVP